MNTSVSPASMDTGVLLLSIMGYVTMATGCPDLCQCNLDYFVYCKNANIGDAQLKALVEKVPLKVRLLDLGYNEIRTLPARIFENLSHLQILNLGSNKVKEISKDALYGLHSLEEVTLNNNDIHEMPGSLWKGMGSLRKLNLADNYMDKFPPKMFVSLTNLTDLNLANNQISALDNNLFSGLQSLVNLDLSNNIIYTIANRTFLDLGSLQTLDLSFNILKVLNSLMFSGLRKLKTLNVSYNKVSDLRNISQSDFHLSLYHLRATNNDLIHIQEDVLSNFNYLRELYLDDNNISTISDRAFLGLNLKTLSVSVNKMTALTREMFRQLRGVQLVDFSHNRITSLSTGVFDSFRDTVLTVQLEHNNLDFIHHGHFRRMLRLQRLDLSHNDINRIEDDAFQDLTDLRDLVLSENDIDTVTPDMVAGPVLLENLYLMCNPLKHFVGFKYENERSNPFSVHMNLTIGTVSDTSIHLTWPYAQGSQIYWTLKILCLDEIKCNSSPFKDQYLAPFKTEHAVTGLSPLAKYYVCINPVFVSDAIDIRQCIFVNKRSVATTTDTVIRVTEPLISNKSPGLGSHMDLIFLVIMTSLLQLTAFFS